jgi:hypothetical protein
MSSKRRQGQVPGCQVWISWNNEERSWSPAKVQCSLPVDTSKGQNKIIMRQAKASSSKEVNSVAPSSKEVNPVDSSGSNETSESEEDSNKKRRARRTNQDRMIEEQKGASCTRNNLLSHSRKTRNSCPNFSKRQTPWTLFYRLPWKSKNPLMTISSTFLTRLLNNSVLNQAFKFFFEF